MSKKAMHTKGPWKLEPTGSFVSVEFPSRVLGTMNSAFASNKNWQANGKLVIASPGMLARLQWTAGILKMLLAAYEIDEEERAELVNVVKGIDLEIENAITYE